MIDREHDLAITKQAEVLRISRGSVYYLPRPVPTADLAIMRRLDRLHLEFPFAGSRMLRGLLAAEGCKVGRRHVKTLMRRMGIEALYRRPRTTKLDNVQNLFALSGLTASSRIRKEQPMSDEKAMGQVIQIDEARIRDHLGEMVRGTVEETLNAMLDAEADQLCGAGRYERSEARQDTRAGSYERTLQTSAGEVSLKVPKLRRQTFETAIIERYRRRESSVEEALIEMYLAGISVRRVEDITEALWGTRVSPSTVSNLNKKIYAKIEAWRNRRIEGEHPYLYLDGIVMKRSWAGEVRNVSLLVASAVNSEGFREILGICEGAKEDKSGWSAFLRHLVDRGLTGVQLIISDACRGLMESAADPPGWGEGVRRFCRRHHRHFRSHHRRSTRHEAVCRGDGGLELHLRRGPERAPARLDQYAYQAVPVSGRGAEVRGLR